MTITEIRNALAKGREELRELVEKRSAQGLSEQEEARFDELTDQVRSLQMQAVAHELGLDKGAESAQTDVRSAFAREMVQVRESGKVESYEMRSGITLSSDISSTTPVLFRDVLEPLEKALVLDKIGVKMQTGVYGEPVWPVIAGVEATLEGEAVEVADSKISSASLKATPHRMSASIPVSWRSINQSNVNLYSYITKQMGIAAARLLNKWMFSTQRLKNATPGVMVDAYNNALTYESGNGVTFRDVVALEAKVLSNQVNTVDETSCYVMGSKMYCDLKSTPIEKGNPKMIIEGGMMNGYPVVVTDHVEEGLILFGVFDYVVASQFGDGRLVVDPVTLAKKDSVQFTLNSEYDITVLRKEAFACLKPQA